MISGNFTQKFCCYSVARSVYISLLKERFIILFGISHCCWFTCFSVPSWQVVWLLARPPTHRLGCYWFTNNEQQLCWCVPPCNWAIRRLLLCSSALPTAAHWERSTSARLELVSHRRQWNHPISLLWWLSGTVMNSAVNSGAPFKLG